MVIQKWLDKNFPTEQEKKRLKEINIGSEYWWEEYDGGELDLSEYPDLEKVVIKGHYLKSPLTKLKLGEKTKLIHLDCSHNRFSEQNLTEINNLIDQNWKNIHLGFTPPLQKLWKGHEFTHQQIKEWIKKGLKPIEYDFANYLKRKGYSSDQELDLVKLKEEHKNDLNWKDIYWEISKLEEEWWEKAGLTYQYSKEWITLFGFEASDYRWVKEWKELNFTLQETKSWLEVGLNKQDAEFAAYLRKNNYTLQVAFQERSKAQIWLDWKYPKEGTCIRRNELYYIDNFGKNRQEITRLFLRGENLQGSLKLEGFDNLEWLDCSRLPITLDLTDCSNLKEVDCSYNELTDLDVNQNKKIEKLVLSRNNFHKDLSFLSGLVNLKELDLNDNKFTGSLEVLKNLSKLEKLYIKSTDIDSGLEYLPDSLKEFNCSTQRKEAKVKVLEEKLNNFGKFFPSNLKNLKRAWQDQQQLSKPSKRGWKTNLEGIDIAPLVPIILNETFKKGDKLLEKHYLEEKDEINYQEIYAKKPCILNSQVKVLPIKLYNIETRKVEKTKDQIDIKNYGIISYVWGDPKKLELVPKLEEKNWWKDNLTVSGNKTLCKAVQTCELWNKTVCQENCGETCQGKCNNLKINYLWMDQLCINQADTPEGLAERNQEVPKMGQYYGNAAVTLISIQSEINENKPLTIDIVEKIIRSEWFRRSWTFQEGWLSKHTIFMFDDMLVDGRTLAADWILYQPAYSEYSRASLGEISEGSVKVATPLGWTYFKNGYDKKDKIVLTLSQVLRGVRPRERTLSIDGIYSVLGLLPYGEKVPVKYEKWGYKYTQKELLEALYDVMKTAWENGYGEALAWHGEGHGLIPGISSVGKGSTNMVGGIVVKRKNFNSNFKLEGVELSGYEWVIENANGELEEIESGRQGFLIDSGLCARNVKIGNEEIKLWGVGKTLEEVKEKHVLIIPSQSEWESNIPFAILAEKDGEIYQRIGLVELRDEDKVSKLQVGEAKQVIIGMNEYVKAKKIERKATILEETQSEQRKEEVEDLKKQISQLQSRLEELQSQIQIPPK
ncbi:MAG: HET domain-containing protein [Candidatus Moeniiplasma glomeromycotorum]|nr:HET domain-containing protein [Candidatus Moeniiplasma glomeromycotorum]MCE8169547.1 HET domain-containing protein [Candidatus Moeniiplasma glomeromycotorum]